MQKIQHTKNTLSLRKRKKVYTEREFKPEESAIELALMHEGRTLRRDQAIDYRKYTQSST